MEVGKKQTDRNRGRRTEKGGQRRTERNIERGKRENHIGERKRKEEVGWQSPFYTPPGALPAPGSR